MAKHSALGPWRLAQSRRIQAASSVAVKADLPELELWDEAAAGRPAPTVEELDAWAMEQESIVQAEASKRATDTAILERWETATAAERWAVVGRFLRERMK